MHNGLLVLGEVCLDLRIDEPLLLDSSFCIFPLESTSIIPQSIRWILYLNFVSAIQTQTSIEWLIK